MGILQSELVPVGVNGPTPITPAPKNIYCKAFQVLRTNTVVTLKAAFPGQATIVNIDMLGSVNSNAGTTATVTLSMASNAGVLSTGVVNVLTNGATTAPVQMTNLPNIQPVPMTGDVQITAVYAETGGASSAGGPWNFVVYYTA